jgi:16S rRNA processing protein RimM
MRKQYLECGKVVTTHGVAGEVRLQPWMSDAEELSDVKTLWLDAAGEQPVRILRARPHKNVVILKLEGVDTVEQAIAYRGRVLYVSRDDLKLAPGQHFVQDLLGMRVIDADDGHLYGTLTDVFDTGANDVYQVTFPDGAERLVPAIPQTIVEIDVDGETMRIRPLKGLFDDAD